MAQQRTCIIVLSYNALEITRKFLNDLYQSTDNFMLIMIDNGSLDDTPRYLKDFASSHSNMILITNETNLGIIGGRNQGYQAYLSLDGKPDYLIFLDNDQFVQKGWLEHHYEVMQQSNADIIGVEAWLLSGSLFPLRQCKTTAEVFSYVGCGGMLINKIVPETLKRMFDEGYNPCYFEDPDFCNAARVAGFCIAWNSKAKLIHLPHSTLGNNPDRMRYFKKSHDYFRSKWHRTSLRPLLQPDVPALID